MLGELRDLEECLERRLGVRPLTVDQRAALEGVLWHAAEVCGVALRLADAWCDAVARFRQLGPMRCA